MKNNEIVAIMKALANETRLKIFNLLANKPLCGYLILDKLEITQPTLSHHMRILCDSGIVKAEKDWKWIYYSQNKTKLKELQLALEDLNNDAK